MIINTFITQVKKGDMTGFRLVKISKIHMIKCLIFQDERKLKDHIILPFLLFYNLA